jgi:hypothetical protein
MKATKGRMGVMSTAIERRTFEAHRADLVRDHAGKVALVKGKEIVGIFDDRAAAMDEGRRRFANALFVVRPIIAVQS